MNKASLIETVAAKLTQISKKQVEEVIDTLTNTIIEELVAGKKVNLVGFGSFEARKRHARGGINPQKPTERITIPEVRVAKFKTGKTLKDSLKGKISPDHSDPSQAESTNDSL
jgi:DNA-binding protein HU-beta